MKYIFLALALLIPNSVVLANNYPLSPESKQFIITSAIAGGIVGGGLGLIAAFDKQSHAKHPKHTTTWEKIKLFPWHYVILPALAAATGAGFVASFFTTEEYLKSAEQELAMLEHNALLDKAMNTDNSIELKKMAFNAQYPTLRTYERLESLLSHIQKAKDYLFTVIKSGTSGLASIAQAALARLNAMEQRITDWMIKLKDSHYFRELAVRTEIDFKNQMIENTKRAAAAAESQARAAHKAADSAWHSAHHAHHASPVYVAPPAVHVHVKR